MRRLQVGRRQILSGQLSQSVKCSSKEGGRAGGQDEPGRGGREGAPPNDGQVLLSFLVRFSKNSANSSVDCKGPSRIGCRVKFSGFRDGVEGAWCRVQGAKCRVQGAGCRVQGSMFTPP